MFLHDQAGSFSRPPLPFGTSQTPQDGVFQPPAAFFRTFFLTTLGICHSLFLWSYWGHFVADERRARRYAGEDGAVTGTQRIAKNEK